MATDVELALASELAVVDAVADVAVVVPADERGGSDLRIRCYGPRDRRILGDAPLGTRPPRALGRARLPRRPGGRQRERDVDDVDERTDDDEHRRHDLDQRCVIVDDRERNGPFVSVDDLERVPGIGPSKLAALRDLVTV